MKNVKSVQLFDEKVRKNYYDAIENSSKLRKIRNYLLSPEEVYRRMFHHISSDMFYTNIYSNNSNRGTGEGVGGFYYCNSCGTITSYNQDKVEYANYLEVSCCDSLKDPKVSIMNTNPVDSTGIYIDVANISGDVFFIYYKVFLILNKDTIIKDVMIHSVLNVTLKENNYYFNEFKSSSDDVVDFTKVQNFKYGSFIKSYTDKIESFNEFLSYKTVYFFKENEVVGSSDFMHREGVRKNFSKRDYSMRDFISLRALYETLKSVYEGKVGDDANQLSLVEDRHYNGFPSYNLFLDYLKSKNRYYNNRVDMLPLLKLFNSEAFNLFLIILLRNKEVLSMIEFDLLVEDDSLELLPYTKLYYLLYNLKGKSFDEVFIDEDIYKYLKNNDMIEFTFFVRILIRLKGVEYVKENMDIIKDNKELLTNLLIDETRRSGFIGNYALSSFRNIFCTIISLIPAEFRLDRVMNRLALYYTNELRGNRTGYSIVEDYSRYLSILDSTKLDLTKRYGGDIVSEYINVDDFYPQSLRRANDKFDFISDLMLESNHATSHYELTHIPDFDIMEKDYEDDIVSSLKDLYEKGEYIKPDLVGSKCSYCTNGEILKIDGNYVCENVFKGDCKYSRLSFKNKEIFSDYRSKVIREFLNNPMVFHEDDNYKYELVQNFLKLNKIEQNLQIPITYLDRNFDYVIVTSKKDNSVKAAMLFVGIRGMLKNILRIEDGKIVLYKDYFTTDRLYHSVPAKDVKNNEMQEIENVLFE